MVRLHVSAVALWRRALQPGSRGDAPRFRRITQFTRGAGNCKFNQLHLILSFSYICLIINAAWFAAVIYYSTVSTSASKTFTTFNS